MWRLFHLNLEARIPLLNNQFFSWNVGLSSVAVCFSTDIFCLGETSGSQIHGNAYRQEWKGAQTKRVVVETHGFTAAPKKKSDFLDFFETNPTSKQKKS